MPIFDTVPNSATTLSINYQPGQNKRLLASKSEAIFSFGDFTVEKSFSTPVLTGDVKNLHFGTFDNLETLNAVNISSNISTTFVQPNELNLPKKNPTSHSYFSSFYTNVASSINKIINEYPYAILSYNNGNINIFDYTEYYNGITLERTSSFKIPVSGLTNQSGIFLNSGDSQSNYSLSYDYTDFCIQISGQTSVFTIKEYAFSGTYLYFLVHDYLKGGNSVSTYTDALYIRPTIERMYNYKEQITLLETQLLGDGIFSIPQTETIADDFVNQKFTWPRTIDGWAPDSYGSDFEVYKEQILNAAESVDEEKTDIFIKTVIPENFLELDSSGQIYRSIIQAYANEFDKLKNYIDAMAYAHNIEYNNEETVPRKFMMKLSSLFGWKLSDSFSELDLFDYLTSDLDGNYNSYSYFNVEIWRRILINIVWLYKKKGTRDAITFIFKLLGAPDCLINFNEFVYDINRTVILSTPKVDIDGYINYSSSLYEFQHGGIGRGNGQDYIHQWRPEFNPIIRNDNRKIEIGDPTGGTRSIVNTKEVELKFSPSQAVECDVWEYYQNSCASWMWGSPCPQFSCMTVPYEFLTFTQENVQPVDITAMTLSQYVDYVYTNSIDPTSRKTNAQCHTTWSYPELKNIYLAYYYATCPENNHLTMCRLEAYLQLLEVQLGSYIAQLVPATTIFDENCDTLYKNPIFHSQRFVYREGIDRGSMFRREIIEPHAGNIYYAVLKHANIIIPSKASNVILGLSAQKIQNTTVVLKQRQLIAQYIETKNAPINCTKITCGIDSSSNNNNRYDSNKFDVKKMRNFVINASIDAATAAALVSDTSQKLVAEEILNY